jgi:hypothetical protein
MKAPSFRSFCRSISKGICCVSKSPIQVFRASHVLIFTLLLVVCFAIALKQLLNGPHPRNWKSDFDVAISLWDLGDNHAKPLIERALEKSVVEKASIADQIAARREFANKLYASHDWTDGDWQLDKAIALSTTAKPEGAEADQLSHAYQDRGWKAHLRYLRNPHLASGEKEQERSYQISRDAFGAQSPAAIYKLATLGLIDVDLGNREKGDSLLDQAKTAVDTVDSARPEGWFVYEILAQAKATENDPQAAEAARLKAISLTSNPSQKERITRDFKAAMKRAEAKKQKSE